MAHYPRNEPGFSIIARIFVDDFNQCHFLIIAFID